MSLDGSQGVCKVENCDENYHVSNETKCVADSKEACGSDTNNCNSIDHRDAVDCKEGACKVISCQQGYHPNDSKTGCEGDSDKICGNSKINCISDSVQNGAGTCVNGACVFSTCQNNYHRTSSNSMKCVLDTVTACGSDTNDCTKKSGWKGGTCMDGKCLAVLCQDGYYPMHGNYHSVQCEKLSPQRCWGFVSCYDVIGYQNVSCENVELEGETYYTCSSSFCDREVSSIDYGSRYDCVSNYFNSNWYYYCASYEYMVCDRSIGYCSEGQHDTVGYGCEPNNVENCGMHGYNCSVAVPGWKDGLCIAKYDVNGVCSAKECEDGYKLVEVDKYYGINRCEPMFEFYLK